MNEIMNIGGIDCYEENGTAYLKLETVARGLGFTTVATSGNEVVRWNRVAKYLDGFGVHTFEHDGFIPENIFYRLAMKAKNETAEKFQSKIADEVIPTIRKTGGYVANDQVFVDTYLPFADENTKTLFKSTLATLNAQNKMIAEMKPKAEFYDQVAEAKGTFSMNEAAKILNLGIGRNKMFEFLREKGILMENNLPYQRYIESGYFKVAEIPYKVDYYTYAKFKTVVTQKGLTFLFKTIINEKNK